jgi:hypothetical protein
MAYFTFRDLANAQHGPSTAIRDLSKLDEKPEPIIVLYTTLDHFRLRRTFKTIEGARRFAQKYVGPHPDISETFAYAVSDDGTGKIEVRGTSIYNLFPKEM